MLSRQAACTFPFTVPVTGIPRKGCSELALLNEANDMCSMEAPTRASGRLERWFILAFAGACALGSAYGFLQGAWPFGLVEAIWAGVAVYRWRQRTKNA